MKNVKAFCCYNSCRKPQKHERDMRELSLDRTVFKVLSKRENINFPMKPVIEIVGIQSIGASLLSG